MFAHSANVWRRVRMNVVREIERINMRELELGVSGTCVVVLVLDTP